MNASDFLRFLQQEIHTVIAATVDDRGLPVTCAIDIMDSDETGLYFLTAKGKGFYNRLKSGGYIALTGIRGKDTMSCVAVSVRGRVKELGSGLIGEKTVYERDLSFQTITTGAHGFPSLRGKRRVVRFVPKACGAD